MPTMNDTAYYLPEFKKNYTEEELQQFIDTELFRRYIASEQNTRIVFLLRGKEYAIFTYRNSKLDSIIYCQSKKPVVTVGKRLTNDFSLLNQSQQILVRKALFTYLSYKKYRASGYARKINFEYQLVRFSDSNTHSSRAEDNLGVTSGGDCIALGGDSNTDGGGDYDSDLSNNMLLRLQSTDEHGNELIPFHSIIFNFSDIREALNSITKKHYIYIHLFCFPHVELTHEKISKKMQADYRKLFKLKYNNELQIAKKLKKAERMKRHSELQMLRQRKNHAVDALITRITEIQIEKRGS